jgi:hypothetical protein
MGNRAVIAFTDRNQPKPEVAVYMHWNGGPESIWAIIDVMKEKRGFCHSAAYSTARFAHLACALVGHDGHSVGIEAVRGLTNMAGMGEDNGLYVFDVSTEKMSRYTMAVIVGDKRGMKKHSDAAVAAEEICARQHKYWKDDGIRAKLRAACVDEKEAA